MQYSTYFVCLLSVFVRRMEVRVLFVYISSVFYVWQVDSGTEDIICTYFVGILRAVGRGMDLCALVMLVVHISSVSYVW